MFINFSSHCSVVNVGSRVLHRMFLYCCIAAVMHCASSLCPQIAQLGVAIAEDFVVNTDKVAPPPFLGIWGRRDSLLEKINQVESSKAILSEQQIRDSSDSDLLKIMDWDYRATQELVKRGNKIQKALEEYVRASTPSQLTLRKANAIYLIKLIRSQNPSEEEGLATFSQLIGQLAEDPVQAVSHGALALTPNDSPEFPDLVVKGLTTSNQDYWIDYLRNRNNVRIAVDNRVVESIVSEKFPRDLSDTLLLLFVDHRTSYDARLFGRVLDLAPQSAIDMRNVTYRDSFSVWLDRISRVDELSDKACSDFVSRFARLEVKWASCPVEEHFRAEPDMWKNLSPAAKFAVFNYLKKILSRCNDVESLLTEQIGTQNTNDVAIYLLLDTITRDEPIESSKKGLLEALLSDRVELSSYIFARLREMNVPPKEIPHSAQDSTESCHVDSNLAEFIQSLSLQQRLVYVDRLLPSSAYEGVSSSKLDTLRLMSNDPFPPIRLRVGELLASSAKRGGEFILEQFHKDPIELADFYSGAARAYEATVDYQPPHSCGDGDDVSEEENKREWQSYIDRHPIIKARRLLWNTVCPEYLRRDALTYPQRLLFARCLWWPNGFTTRDTKRIVALLKDMQATVDKCTYRGQKGECVPFSVNRPSYPMEMSESMLNESNWYSDLESNWGFHETHLVVDSLNFGLNQNYGEEHFRGFMGLVQEGIEKDKNFVREILSAGSEYANQVIIRLAISDLGRDNVLELFRMLLSLGNKSIENQLKYPSLILSKKYPELTGIINPRMLTVRFPRVTVEHKLHNFQINADPRNTGQSPEDWQMQFGKRDVISASELPEARFSIPDGSPLHITASQKYLTDFQRRADNASAGAAFVPLVFRVKVDGVLTGLEYGDRTFDLRPGIFEGSIEKVFWPSSDLDKVFRRGPDVPKATSVVGSFVLVVGEPVSNTMSVPPLVGLSKDDVAIGLQTLGLSVGKVSESSSNTIAPGRVISSDPSEGISVELGSKIDLVIARSD